MIYTPAQIRKIAYDAGFRGAALEWAVAVALAESGGNSNAYNPETAAGTRPGSGSRGLWQIYGQAHPEFNSDRLYDPLENAKAAYKVYSEAGGRFSPWSTYNNGSAAKIAGKLTPGQKAAYTVDIVATTSGRAPAPTVSSDGKTPAWAVSLLPAQTSRALETATQIVTRPDYLKNAGTNFLFSMGGLTLVIIGIVLFFYAGKSAIVKGTAETIKEAL